MWLNNIENKEVVNSIYGENTPSLDGVIIKELKLHYNGPIAELVVELQDYPLEPPKKWSLNKYNKVDLLFQLIEIKSMNITKWDHINNCNLIILETKEGLVMKATGDCAFELNINWIRIESISAYRSDD